MVLGQGLVQIQNVVGTIFAYHQAAAVSPYCHNNREALAQWCVGVAAPAFMNTTQKVTRVTADAAAPICARPGASIYRPVVGRRSTSSLCASMQPPELTTRGCRPRGARPGAGAVAASGGAMVGWVGPLPGRTARAAEGSFPALQAISPF